MSRSLITSACTNCQNDILANVACICFFVSFFVSFVLSFVSSFCVFRFPSFLLFSLSFFQWCFTRRGKGSMITRSTYTHWRRGRRNRHRYGMSLNMMMIGVTVMHTIYPVTNRMLMLQVILLVYLSPFFLSLLASQSRTVAIGGAPWALATEKART